MEEWGHGKEKDMQKSNFSLGQWSFVRVLRLVFAIMIAFQAIETESWWMLLLTAVLLYQVVKNVSCSGGACEIPQNNIKDKK